MAEQAGGPSYKEPGQSRGESPQQVLHHTARSSFKNSGRLARRGGRRFRTTVQRWMGTIFYTVHDGRLALVQRTGARLQLMMGRQPRGGPLLHIWHRIAAVHRTLLLDLAQRRFARRFCETILIFFFFGGGAALRGCPPLQHPERGPGKSRRQSGVLLMWGFSGLRRSYHSQRIIKIPSGKHSATVDETAVRAL